VVPLILGPNIFPPALANVKAESAIKPTAILGTVDAATRVCVVAEPPTLTKAFAYAILIEPLVDTLGELDGNPDARDDENIRQLVPSDWIQIKPPTGTKIEAVEILAP
jgi:hypothetical protein